MTSKRIAIWIGRATVLVVLAGALGSCAKTPYSLRVTDVDETGPQRSAAIQLSDPQVYSRENLINDRRKEEEYLKELLEESKKIPFSPQLQRDLRALEAISGALALTFDPTGGLAPEDRDLYATQRELDALRLEKDIVAARRELHAERLKPLNDATETAERTVTGEEVVASATVPPTGETPPPEKQTDPPPPVAEGSATKPTPPNTPDTMAVRDRLASLHTRLGKLVDLAETEAGKGAAKPRATDVPADPEEEFNDRQAYRARIRSELAAVRLDDLHDYQGNGLYRLQFQATVLPGKDKDKWGVTRLTVEPPKMDDDEFEALYRAWLVHVTLRMNPIDAEAQLDTDYVYEALATESELDGKPLYRILRVPFGEVFEAGEPAYSCNLADTSRSRGKNDLDFSRCHVLRFAIPPDETFRKMSQDITAGTFRFHLKGLRSRSRDSRNKNATSNYGTFIEGERSKDAAKFATNFYELWPFIASSVQTMRRYTNADTGNSAAATAISDLQALAAWGAEFSQKRDQPFSISAPTGFKNLICIALDGAAKGGSAFAYATSPAEEAQRISTVASSARSLELAMSLSATLAQYGVEGDGDLGSLQTLSGSVEARERIPSVVGFSDRVVGEFAIAIPDWCEGVVLKSSRLPKKGQRPQFGWVFGPKARIDAEQGELVLEHTVASHDVSADISVPGWWPGIELELERAWVQNWHTDGSVFRNDESRFWWQVRDGLADAQVGEVFGLYSGVVSEPEKFRVRLPLSASDLDGLTDLVAFSHIGPVTQRASITRVSPLRVPVCAEKVTFRVYGRNVWQSTEAFLAGTAASKITVLPHMEGIAAEFTLADVYKGANATSARSTQFVDLTVESRYGYDGVGVYLRGSRTKTACASNWQIAPADYTYEANLAQVTPTWIPACEKKLTLFASGGYLTKIEDARLGPFSVVASKPDPDSPNWRLEVDARPHGFARYKGSNLDLAISTEYGLVSDSLPVRACQAKPPAKPAAKPTALGDWIVKGTAKRLAMKGTKAQFPAQKSGMNIAVRPVPSPTHPWVPGTNPTSKSGVLEDTVKLAATVPWVGALKNGDKLQVARRRVASPGGTPNFLIASNPIVYYASASAIDVASENPTVATLPADVSLRFPKSAVLAFPGLKSKKLAATARIEGNPGIKLVVTAPKGFAPDAADLVSIRIEVDPGSAAAFAAAHTADLKLLITWKGTPAAVPPLALDLKVKK